MKVNYCLPLFIFAQNFSFIPHCGVYGQIDAQPFFLITAKGFFV